MSNNELSNMQKVVQQVSEMIHTDGFRDTCANLRKLSINVKYNESVMLLHADYVKYPEQIVYGGITNQDFADCCNGLVFDTIGNALMVGQRRPQTGVEYNMVKRNVASYTVYNAIDGTTIGLYYLDGWVISTARGHTMNNVKLGDFTYEELLSAAVESNGLTLEEFYSSLDTNASYSVTIVTQLQHVFAAVDKPETKRVEQYNRLNSLYETTTEANKASARLVIHTKWLDGKYVPVDDALSAFVDKPMEVESVTDLFGSASQAYQAWKTSNYICFGYILRCDSGGSPDVLIQSSLKDKIQQCFYARQYMLFSQKYNVSMQQVSYIAAGLMPELRPIYQSLILDTDFKDLDNKLDYLAAEIVKNIRGAVDSTYTNRDWRFTNATARDIGQQQLIKTAEVVSGIVGIITQHLFTDIATVDGNEQLKHVGDIIRSGESKCMNYLMRWDELYSA